jgi:predicted house-cleaning NTP pyrophosphatase (Maf/HAM1 superfamily)
MTQIGLILASASGVRRKLLADAGLQFDAVDSLVDEDAVKAGFANGDQSPEDATDALALALADAKAVSLCGKVTFAPMKSSRCRWRIVSAASSGFTASSS